MVGTARRARLCPPYGSEELIHILLCGPNLPQPHLLGAVSNGARNRCASQSPKERTPGMRTQRIVLSLVVMIVGGIAAAGPARSEEYHGTYEQQMAGPPAVCRLSFDQIPDANPIPAPLRQNPPHLPGPSLTGSE